MKKFQLASIVILSSLLLVACNPIHNAERALSKHYEEQGYDVKECTLFKTGENEYKGTITYSFTQKQLDESKQDFANANSEAKEAKDEFTSSILGLVGLFTQNMDILQVLVGEELTSEVEILYNGSDLQVVSDEFDANTSTKISSLLFNQMLKGGSDY